MLVCCIVVATAKSAQERKSLPTRHTRVRSFWLGDTAQVARLPSWVEDFTSGMSHDTLPLRYRAVGNTKPRAAGAEIDVSTLSLTGSLVGEIRLVWSITWRTITLDCRSGLDALISLRQSSTLLTYTCGFRRQRPTSAAQQRGRFSQ